MSSFICKDISTIIAQTTLLVILYANRCLEDKKGAIEKKMKETYWEGSHMKDLGSQSRAWFGLISSNSIE